jgi:F1F0 ATPase subunit 2
MSSVCWLALAFMAGAVLGGLYFGGLWITVRRLPEARRPALLSLGSLLARLSLVLGGFYLVGAGDWRRFVLALLGFVGARTILVRLCEGKRPLSAAKVELRP